jgi:4-amino-4-deoxy-L-arabinose transferase-like glycosyltransferase
MAKALQFLPCLYGILHLILVLAIIHRLPMTRSSRLIAFGIACFTPSHIYASAIHSNDTLSYLFVALCLYLVLEILDSSFSLALALLLSCAISLSVFTKYTSFAIIPAVLAFTTLAYAWRVNATRKRIALCSLVIFLLPSVLLAYSFTSNRSQYGTILPYNVDMVETPLRQRPGPGRIEFHTFKLLTLIREPIMSPNNIESFWTQVYGRTWFNMEPILLPFTNQDYKDAYSRFFNNRRRRDWPGIHLTPATLGFGRVLIILGLIPLAFVVIGAYTAATGKYRLFRGERGKNTIKVQMLIVLLIFNIIGIMRVTSLAPHYGSMKALYFHSSMPAFAVLIGLGLERFGMRRLPLLIAFGALFFVVAAHILHLTFFA